MDESIIVQTIIATAPVSVAVVAAAQPVAVAIQSQPQPVQVIITEAPAGVDGPPGPAGANATIVILTLAEYLALSPEAQMNGTWYVIPKT